MRAAGMEVDPWRWHQRRNLDFDLREGATKKDASLVRAEGFASDMLGKYARGAAELQHCSVEHHLLCRPTPRAQSSKRIVASSIQLAGTRPGT